MKNTGKKLIIISFVLALLCSVVLFIYIKSLEKKEEVGKSKTILIAAEVIPANTLIEKKMVKEVEVLENEIVNNYINNSNDIVGKYAKDIIFQGEGFLKERLMNESSNDLSIKIDNNHRAVSINATADVGVADLLRPGHYVDIVVYLPEKKDGDKIIRQDMAKIILQNVKIIAIDKEINRQENKEEKIEEVEKMPTTFLVTLSVPVYDVEKLVLAEDIGSLKLVLRPLEKQDNLETEGTTWEELTLAEKKEFILDDIEDTSTDYVYYTIKKGDSLRKISEDFYGDRDKYRMIMSINNIYDRNLIEAGMKIKIPVIK